MRLLFAPFTWLFRVLLWIVVWPIGLWRSLAHSRKKSERRLLKAIDQQPQAQAQVIARPVIPGVAFADGMVPPPPSAV